MAEFTGLALTGCRMPGLQAGNLRVTADLLLADRIVVGGTCYARRLRSAGEQQVRGDPQAPGLQPGIRHPVSARPVNSAMCRSGAAVKVQSRSSTGRSIRAPTSASRPVTVARRRRSGPPAAASTVASASAGSSAEPRSTSRPAASSAAGRPPRSAGAGRRRSPAGVFTSSAHRRRGVPVRRSTHTPTASVAGVPWPRPSGDAHGAAPDVTGTPPAARRPPTPPTRPADAPRRAPAAPPQQLRPRRHLRPGRAAARGAAARSSRPTPRTRSAGPARARGTRCAPDRPGRSSRASRCRAPVTNSPSRASVVRHRAAARQFRLPTSLPPRSRPPAPRVQGATPHRRILRRRGSIGHPADLLNPPERAVPPMSSRHVYLDRPCRHGADAGPRTLVDREAPRHLLRPVALLLGLCLVAGVLAAGMAFPAALALGWCRTRRATA